MEAELKLAESKNLGNVHDYEDFCKLIFGLKSADHVKAEIVNIYFGKEPGLTNIGKIDFLKRRIFDGSEVRSLFIFDDEGNKYDILNICANLNPESVGGKGNLTDLGNRKRDEIIKRCWLEDSRFRAQGLADELGGVWMPLNNYGYESGIHSAIFFVDDENKGRKINVFRGVRELSPEKLDKQVCGMLRVRNSSSSKVIEDGELVEAVGELAEKPSEKLMDRIIKRYGELGFLGMQDTTEMVLKSIRSKMKRNNIDFEEALEDVHIELYSGVTGGSPYLATTTHMEETINHTGNDGAVLVIQPNESKVKPSKRRGEKEIFVKLGIERPEIAALIPINRLEKVEDEVWKLVEAQFNKAEEEVLQCLDIFYND